MTDNRESVTVTKPALGKYSREIKHFLAVIACLICIALGVGTALLTMGVDLSNKEGADLVR